MAYIPLEKLLKKEESSQSSHYKLVLTAAARANELTQGATPLVETNSKKVSTIALEEIAAQKVWYEHAGKKSKKSE